MLTGASKIVSIIVSIIAICVVIGHPAYDCKKENQMKWEVYGFEASIFTLILMAIRFII